MLGRYVNTGTVMRSPVCNETNFFLLKDVLVPQ